MEIGSFIELDVRNTGEYYAGETNVARLNAARAGIYHACRLYNCDAIYIPYYLCPTVSQFLTKKGIRIIYYQINGQFIPEDIDQTDNTAFLIVNYFGILSNVFVEKISSKFKNVIVDNSAAFFAKPIVGCYNVYSPRKFFGVPDGCYVIGEKASMFTEEYIKDFSADTALFLLKRIEQGCSAVYSERMKNEERIDKSDIMLMSDLTRTLLGGIDYDDIKIRRRVNFDYAQQIYKEINLINPIQSIDEMAVPMVFPLVLKNSEIVDKLKEENVYTGRWWKSVIHRISEKSFESFLSNYMIPISIDQRYDKNIISFVANRYNTEENYRNL